ncbi:MAG: hypothetical protein Q7S48_01405 [bacterium]|nr:hypothetical protein [bacterium]
MIDRERQPDIPAENKEYNFEKGFEQIFKKIGSLLSTQDYVLISISGPSHSGGDTMVGKSTLATEITKNCLSNGIPCVITSSTRHIDHILKGQIDSQKSFHHSSKCVVIFGAAGNIPTDDPETQEYFKKSENQGIQKSASEIGLSFSKIDMHVLIYRPDNPPEEVEKSMPDMVIRNEHAKDR